VKNKEPILSTGIKQLAKTITLKEFNSRFEISEGHIKDKVTEKIYYCPYDLGFNFTFEDCKVSCCKECWEEAIESMKFKEKTDKSNTNRDWIMDRFTKRS